MICALLLCVEAVLPACTGTTDPACRYEFTSSYAFNSAEFSPDGLLVATSTWNANPVVRSTQDGSVVATLVTEPKRKSVLFSPNGQEIVVACEKSVQVFSTTTWLELHKINFFTNVIFAVAYSHDSAHLAVATDTFAAVYTTSGTLVVKFTGHGYTSSVAFSPDDSQVVSGGIDSTARVWSSTTAVESLAMTHGAFVSSIAWSDDGKQIATTGFSLSGSTAKLWNALDGSELTAFSYNAPNYPVRVAFAPSSKQVAIGAVGSGVTQGVTLFGTEAPYAPQAVYPIGGLCLSYSKQGDFLSTCSIGVFPYTMTVWDVPQETSPRLEGDWTSSCISASSSFLIRHTEGADTFTVIAAGAVTVGTFISTNVVQLSIDSADRIGDVTSVQDAQNPHDSHIDIVWRDSFDCAFHHTVQKPSPSFTFEPLEGLWHSPCVHYDNGAPGDMTFLAFTASNDFKIYAPSEDHWNPNPASGQKLDAYNMDMTINGASYPGDITYTPDTTTIEFPTIPCTFTHEVSLNPIHIPNSLPELFWESNCDAVVLSYYTSRTIAMYTQGHVLTYEAVLSGANGISKTVNSVTTEGTVLYANDLAPGVFQISAIYWDDGCVLKRKAYY